MNWDWLKDNSAALQALAAFATLLMTLPVLIWTGYVALRAARASEKQAQAARAQVVAASVAAALAREQLQAATEQLAATREQNETLKSQLLASLRPVLVFSWSKRTSLSSFDHEHRKLLITNESTTAVVLALKVKGRQPGEHNPLRVSRDLLGPGAQATVEDAVFEDSDYFIAEYRSGDGRSFITEAHRIEGTALHQETWQTDEKIS